MIYGFERKYCPIHIGLKTYAILKAEASNDQMIKSKGKGHIGQIHFQIEVVHHGKLSARLKFINWYFICSFRSTLEVRATGVKAI